MDLDLSARCVEVRVVAQKAHYGLLGAGVKDREACDVVVGPGFFETVFAEVDLRPGGRYELLLEPGSMRLVGEFREVTPPRRLVYTWRWVQGVPDTRESLVTVEFREDGPLTEVVLVHDNFVGPGPVDMYDEAGGAASPSSVRSCDRRRRPMPRASSEIVIKCPRET